MRAMTRYGDRNADYLLATALDAHSSLMHLNQRGTDVRTFSFMREQL